MENASKALIIAGAILISIVLVSVGVIVVQSLDPSSATEKMDEQAVQSFNSKFDAYMGQNVSGTNVRSLIAAVVSNNITNEDDESKKVGLKITLKDTSKNADIQVTDAEFTTKANDAKKNIGTGKRYKVEVPADGTQSSGIISKIEITEK